MIQIEFFITFERFYTSDFTPKLLSLLTSIFKTSWPFEKRECRLLTLLFTWKGCSLSSFNFSAVVRKMEARYVLIIYNEWNYPNKCFLKHNEKSIVWCR